MTMKSFKTQTAYVSAHPVKTGIFAILAVVALGSASAFALGFEAPQKAFAQLAPPIAPLIVTAPIFTPIAPILPIIPTPIIPLVPVITPIISGLTVTAAPSGTDTSNTPVDTSVPTTTTSPFELPCCTVTSTDSVTTPVIAVAVTPVVPVIPTPPTPPVPPVDVCVNIDGIQSSVPSGMTRDGSGNCTPTQPVVICTLTASASTITPGQNVTLTWTTQNATSFVLNQGIGAVTPTTGGTKVVQPTGNTTYVGTAYGPGGPVTCQAPVTVTTVSNAPICTLTASASSVAPGSSVTLSWTTRNVSSASIDNGVGSATPVAAGTRSVVVNANTTYTLTGTGTNGQTVTCSAPVTVPPPSPTPICTLSASAGTVAPGTSVDLVYSTTNVSSASIDNGVGNLIPVTSGTKSVIVNADTTYTLTGTGTNGQPVTCAAPVRVSTGGGGSPICTLTASPTSLNLGDSATITWGGNRIVSVSIDNGIGPVSGVSGSKTVTPTAKGTYTYIGSFLATNGTTLTCQATIEVTGGGGGCTSNCGGGGSSKPRVVLSSLKTPGEQPLAFVYLSQIPYTGLDLGPWGTALYWMMLMLWSLAAAYLVLFNGLPLAYRKVGSFGANVKEVLKQPVAVSTHTVTTHAAPASHAPAQHTAPSHTASHSNTHEHTAPAEAPKGYQAYQAQEGFRSFATEGALSIDDIVKGLAREAQAHPAATAHDIRPDFLVETSTNAHGEPSHHVYVDVPAQTQSETVIEAVVPMPTPEPVLAPVNEDVRSFIAALLSGDRETVFGTIRGITRTGGDSEAFLTHAVCALDDAYRSRVDGSVCHPDIAAVTADCHPSFLERVVTALTTAVDGSYSTGVTGVKLALTRALAVVNG